MCIFEDMFFSCVLLPNSVVCTRRFLQGAAQSLPRVVCRYTLSIGESVGPTTLGRDWALLCLILNQYNNKIPKAINTITNYRKPISATYTRTKTHHKHRGICCLLSLVKTCLTHYSIILNLTTVNIPRIENIIFFNLQKKTVA
jgi:hypothetical protein